MITRSTDDTYARRLGFPSVRVVGKGGINCHPIQSDQVCPFDCDAQKGGFLANRQADAMGVRLHALARPSSHPT